MRTTLTIEPDVATGLQSVMSRRKLTLNKAVNETLRQGLSQAAVAKVPRFKVRAHGCGGFQQGVDPAKLGHLADDLESKEFLRKRRVMTPASVRSLLASRRELPEMRPADEAAVTRAVQRVRVRCNTSEVA